jgi:hypothetical protein
MNTKTDVVDAAIFGFLIGITVGAFVRVFRLTIRIPVVAHDMFRRDFRPHFMYYPTVAFTVLALVMILNFGIHGHPGMIFYGLFLGWLAGDLNYYSNKWVSSNRWVSWCPGLGYANEKQIVKSKNETYYIAILGLITAVLVIFACAPAFGYFP